MIKSYQDKKGKVVRNKYNDFYYCVDNKIHPDTDYWDLHTENKIEAIRKYEDKIYCPLCLQAPLSVAIGEQRKYFKVAKSNMDKHLTDCPNLLDEATQREVKEFYIHASDKDIINRLTVCMNRMLKSELGGFSLEKNNKTDKSLRELSVFVIENTRKVKKYLPNLSLYSKGLEEDLGRIKIYYGKCKIWHKGTDGGRHYIYLLNYATNSQICSLSASSKVYEYLRLNLSDEKNNAKEYYVCFIAELAKNGKFLNAVLKDSRMAKFETVR